MATPLLERLSSNAAKTPDKLAMAFLGSGPNGGVIEKEMKYQDVMKQTSALAANLLASGLKKGDLAVLVFPPSLDFIIAFLACLTVGIVAVPVFPPHPARKDTLLMFSKIVQSCNATYALTSASYSHMKKLASLKDAFSKFIGGSKAVWPEKLKWITTDTLDPPSKKYVKLLSSYTTTTTTTSNSNTTSTHNTPSDSLAFLQFTSGSTSEPKGVQITHGNLADNLHKITSSLHAGPDTIVASWLPQYHDMGLIGSYLGTLYCGGMGYYTSPLTFVQRPVLWVEMVGRFRATHLQAPNFAFKLTARKFVANRYRTKDEQGDGEVLDLSSVQHIINAAEPVTEESIDKFRDAFRPFGLPDGVVFPTYGLAEHTVFVCSGGKQRLSVCKQSLEVDGVVVKRVRGEGEGDGHKVSRLIGCGYPAEQDVDLRIVDAESRREMEEDRVGEIWIRSPSKAAGYFNRPEDSRREFCARIDDTEGSVPESANDGDDFDVSDGYLRSGDLGFMHEKELFVCGRIKDLIIVGGRNYYPQDVEATAEGAASKTVRPGCSAAFTVDPISGEDEEVAMVLELKEVPSTKDVESVCSNLVATIRSAITKEHSLTLSHVVLLPPRTVQKTSSGKIARAWCRKAFLNNTFVSVYTQSFQKNPTEMTPLEIEDNGSGKEVILEEYDRMRTDVIVSDDDGKPGGGDIRSLDKAVILDRLKHDISQMMAMEEPPDDKALNTFMDSLSISQFKGLLEGKYLAKISDEYLFQERCTLGKIVEVVKLGYAPDDVDQAVFKGVKRRKGLSGALGCPPTVKCTVM